MDDKLLGNLKVIEKKKKGLYKAVVSLRIQLKFFENLLDSTEILRDYEAQKSVQEKSIVGFDEKLCSEKNQLKICKNPMNQKQKSIDFDEEKLKKMWEKLEHKEREIEGKVKEMEFNRRFIEERAMELESRQKQLDDGFRELELKKMEYTQRMSGIITCSDAGGKIVKLPVSARWDDYCHSIFTELCVDEVRKGNRPRPTTTLSKAGWGTVRQEFIARTGRPYSTKQLKNHLDCMKTDWNLFKHLKGHMGIEWNQEKKTIAVDDAWWDAQIKINHKYGKFRNKDLSLIWFSYGVLFGDTTAENKALVPIGPSPVAMKLENKDYIIDETNSAEKTEGSGESSDSQASRQPVGDDIPVTDNIPSPMISEHEKNTRGTKRKKVVLSTKNGLDSPDNIMASKSTESSFHTDDAPSIEECMDKLEDIEGFPKNTPLYWYSQNLFTRPDMRTIFMKQLCDRARLGWLEFNYSEYQNTKSA